jgi:hypothetical protein
MPFDGLGNYTASPVPNFPAVTGTAINSSYYNNVINDIVTAFNNCLTRDGQGKPSASINWNGQTITNIAGISATGLILTAASAVGAAGFRLPHGVAPAAPTNGDFWTTTAGLFGRINGATVSFGVSGAITASAFTMSTARLLGRSTAATGAIEEISLGATLALAAGSLAVASVPNALTFNNAGGGAASGTTFNGSAARTISYDTVGAAPVNPQVQSVVSAATVTPVFGNDMVKVTAQAAALNFANPTGTAVEGWGIVLRIKDNGTARAITWGAQYRAFGGGALPTTTVLGKTLYVNMIFNQTDTKWDVVATSQET